MKTENTLERFAEMMVTRMEQMKASDWKKGWLSETYGESPMNLSGRTYNGMNSFFLFLEMMNEPRFKYPIFATFQQIKQKGASVLKGEKSFPVLFWMLNYKDKNGKRIDEDDYNSMPAAIKQECDVSPVLKSFNVFNVAQTNMEEVAPKPIEKLKEKYRIGERNNSLPTDIGGMYENEQLDSMLANQSWYCPITYDKYSNSAFYSLNDDKITVPVKSQFRISQDETSVFEDGQEYYATLIHEMIHSTGSESRLGRFGNGSRTKDDYAKEELVAELGAALVGNALGFSSRVLNNNAAYLDSWISKLKKQPKYIVSVLSAASKAAKMVLDVVDAKVELFAPAI